MAQAQSRGELHSIGTRLDRLYVSTSLADKATFSSVPTTLSDHDLISVSIDFSRVQRGRSYWKLNQSTLERDDYKARIRRTIATFAGKATRLGALAAWDALKKHIKVTTKLYCADLNLLHRCMNEDAQQHLQDAVAAWQDTPCAETATRLTAARDAARDHAQRAYDAAAIRSRATWLIEGERPTRLFCGLERARQRQCNIQTLQHPVSNDIVSAPRDLCDAARTFYSNLYTPEHDAEPHALNSLVQHLPRITDAQREACDAALSLDELTTAVRLMPHHKAPGLDGLPAEFYTTFWEQLGPILLRVFRESLATGALPSSMREGVLSLLFKKGDPTLLGNYRPLTMINVDAKILAKALARRLDRVLPSLVHPDQTGFVQGRYIHENSLLIRGIIDHHRRTNIPGAILFLDQEKAFDRVLWDFRDAVLGAAGFGPGFTSLVRLLHVGLNAKVQVNGHLTEPFPVLRGTRQGCPLSPGLYALLAEAFACALRARPDYAGLPMPDGGYGLRAKISLFADDTTALLGGPGDIAPLTETLQQYKSRPWSRASWRRLRATRTPRAAHAARRPRRPRLPRPTPHAPRCTWSPSLRPTPSRARKRTTSSRRSSTSSA